MTSCGPRPQASYHSDLPLKKRLQAKNFRGRGAPRAPLGAAQVTRLSAGRPFTATRRPWRRCWRRGPTRRGGDVVETSEPGGEVR